MHIKVNATIELVKIIIKISVILKKCKLMVKAGKQLKIYKNIQKQNIHKKIKNTKFHNRAIS